MKLRYCIICVISFFSNTSIVFSQKKIDGNKLEEKIEFFFPVLNIITKELDGNAPIIKESNELINEADSKKIIADSAKGLSANLNIGSHSIHENRPGQSYYHSYRTIASIAARKPLYYWGALKAKSKIAELSKKFALQKTESIKTNLVIQIKSDFMDLLYLNYKLTLEKEALKFSEENEEKLIEKQKLGLGTELEISEATIRKLEQSILIEETERVLEIKKSYFQFDTGYYNSIILSIPKEFIQFCSNHEFGKNIPQLISSHSSKDIENLKTSIQSEKENIKIAEASLKPKINLIGGVYQDQIDLPDTPDSVRRNNFLVGIEANWNIWDSSRSKGEKSLALAQKRTFEIQLESSIRELRLKIKGRRSQLNNLSNQITLSKKLASTAKSRFKKSQIEFNENLITVNELHLSRLSLTEAELGLIKSVFKYFQLKLEYEMSIKFPHS
ncbi:MAG: TolC family protein [Opitutae bacterium]|nr:TolC family protein [Opitutae bacterium]